jgi:hypothetical protein
VPSTVNTPARNRHRFQSVPFGHRGCGLPFPDVDWPLATTTLPAAAVTPHICMLQVATPAGSPDRSVEEGPVNSCLARAERGCRSLVRGGAPGRHTALSPFLSPAVTSALFSGRASFSYRPTNYRSTALFLSCSHLSLRLPCRGRRQVVVDDRVRGNAWNTVGLFGGASAPPKTAPALTILVEWLLWWS